MKPARGWIFAACSFWLFVQNPAAADDAAPLPLARSSDSIFVVKPYLQIGRNPAPGSLLLLWHVADSDADWTVEYRNAADQPWLKSERVASRRVAVAGIEPHRIYRDALTGLASGGTFSCRVLKGVRSLSQPRGRLRSRPTSRIGSWPSATAGRARRSSSPWPIGRFSPGPIWW